MATSIEKAFTEEWVWNTLRRALPSGVADHRTPEVVRSVLCARRTWESIDEAFFRPLQLFVRIYSPEHKTLRKILDCHIERLLDDDIRPYVGEWIANQNIEWAKKSPTYWKGVFGRSNIESRIPNIKPHGRAHRSHGAQWTRTVARYELKWRLPDHFSWAHKRGEIRDPSDWVRRVRHIERGIRNGNFPAMIPFDLAASYGPRVSKLLEKEINKMESGLDFVDNVRVAALDDKRELSHYRWLQRHGCCGSEDRQVEVLGRRFTIGCNYGH